MVPSEEPFARQARYLKIPKVPAPTIVYVESPGTERLGRWGSVEPGERLESEVKVNCRKERK